MCCCKELNSRTGNSDDLFECKVHFQRVFHEVPEALTTKDDVADLPRDSNQSQVIGTLLESKLRERCTASSIF